MYKNTQVHKYKVTQVHKNTSKQVQEYASRQIKVHNFEFLTINSTSTIILLYSLFHLNLVDLILFQLNSSDCSWSYLCYKSCCTSNYPSSVVSASAAKSASIVSSKAVHRPVKGAV